MERHYDVQKGTFLWFATMWNETITEFPVLDPVKKATYNSIGGDSPSIGAGWEIEYTSRMEYETLKSKILEYIKNNGFEITEVEQSEWYSNWFDKDRDPNSNQYFLGDKNYENLHLWFQKKGNLTKVQCTIID